MKPNLIKCQKRRALWQARSSFVFFLCAAITSGCRPASPHPRSLNGQWLLEMDTAAELSGGGPPVARGIVVLDSDLPRYPDDPGPSDSTIIGRAYINLAPAGPNSERRFQQGPGADRIETVHVLIRGTQVIIDLAPHLKDASSVLIGRLSRGSIAGTWSVTVENAAPLQRSFTMKRVRRNEYADSAVTRAARGVQQWNAS